MGGKRISGLNKKEITYMFSQKGRSSPNQRNKFLSGRNRRITNASRIPPCPFSNAAYLCFFVVCVCVCTGVRVLALTSTVDDLPPCKQERYHPIAISERKSILFPTRYLMSVLRKECALVICSHFVRITEVGGQIIGLKT